MLLPLFSVLLISLVGFGSTLLLLFPQRRQSFIKIFFILQLIYFCWALSAILLLVSPNQAFKEVMTYIRYLFVPFALPLWIVLIAGVFQKEIGRKYKSLFPFLFVFPAFIALTAALHLLHIPVPWSEYFISQLEPVVVGEDIHALSFVVGPIFRSYVFYSYLILSVVVYISVKTCLSGPKYLKTASLVFFLAGFLHVTTDLLAMLLFPEFRWVQVTIASALPLLMASYWVITRHDMFTLKSLAKDKILSEMPLATLTFSPLGELWDFNQVAARILKLHFKDLGLSLADLQNKINVDFSVSQLNLDGRIYQVHKRYLPLQFDVEPALIYSFSDITDIRSLSLELSNQNERLLVLNQELSKAIEFNHQVFSVLSHDLSGSLSSVNMLLESLIHRAQQDKDLELQATLELTLNSQRSALDLLSDLLKWNLLKSESLSQNALRSPSECLERVLTHLTAQSTAKKVRFSIEDQTENETGLVSSHLFETILRNIISNSIRYSHQGSEVRIRLHNKAPGLRVEVIDNGHGVSSEVVEHINGHRPQLKPSDEGFGVGLFFTRRFVKEMGGSFQLTSEHKMGTLVVVELPLLTKDLT